MSSVANSELDPNSLDYLPPITASNVFAFAMMILGMFMAVLDIQIVAASLSEIQAGLGASADEIAWVQTAYLVAEVVMIPLSGFLSRAFSIRWLFAMSAGGFTLASIACALVTSIEGMMVARAIQGFVGGAMIPLVYSALFLMFGRRRQAVVMAMVSFLVTLAPTIGPTLGGWLTSVFSWHWLFLINVIPGIFITLTVVFLVEIDEPDFSLLKKTDYLGAIGLSVLSAGLVYVLEEGARYQWFEDPTIRWVSAATIVGAFLLAWRSITYFEPIVNFTVFKNANFTAGTLVGVVFGVGLYGLVYLYPVFLGRVGGMSSVQIGMAVMVTGITMTAMAPISGYLANNVDQRLLAIIGFGLLSISCWQMSLMTSEWRAPELVLPQILRGVGTMLGIVSVTMMAFAKLPPNLVKDATGLFTLMRNVGGAIGIALINTVIISRTNFHQARLAEWANVGREIFEERLEMLAGLALNYGLADPDNFAIRAMAGMIQREALTMAMADSFIILTAVLSVGVIVPFFLARPQGPAKPMKPAQQAQ